MRRRSPASGGAAPGQKELVQLDGVHGDIHHVVQQGTARAEIVQRGLHSIALEGGKQALHPVVLRDHRRLGQFDLQHPGADVVLFQNLAVLLGGGILPGQYRRDVHRNGQQPMSGLCIALQELGHLLEDVQIQIHDAARGFQNGNELVRVDHGAVRLDPAGQRLGSDDREIFGRELELEVQLELAVLKRLRQAAQQLTGQGLLDLQLFVKLDSRHAGVAVHLLAGKVCLVDGGRGAQAAGLNGVHTHPHPQAYLRVMLGLILLKLAAEVMPRLTSFTARCLLR